MHYTNKYNLPEWWVNALKFDDYDKEGDYSITGLAQPVQMTILEELCDDDIYVDVSEMAYILGGRAIHMYLEHVEAKDTIRERRLKTVIRNRTVTGKIDDYRLWDERLSDIKAASKWVIKRWQDTGRVKEEWEGQDNGYSFLLKENGYNTKSQFIEAWLRDWSMMEAARDPSMPQCQIAIVPVPFWGEEATYDYLERRVYLHDTTPHRNLNLPHCTAEERWERLTEWKVKKAANKTAYRGGAHFETEKAAQTFLETKPIKDKPEIVKHLGESVRCEHWCRVKAWCCQYEIANSGGNDGFNGE